MTTHVDTSRIESVDVHLLPCAIEHSGDAQVSTYFHPRCSGTFVEEAEVLESSFRGRALRGTKLALPDEYTGYIMVKKEREEEGLGLAWATTHTFQDLHYWNHDSQPTKGDGICRCLDWAALAVQVHAPVAVEEENQ